ncbi:Uncharacterised protein [Nocardia asteroides]|nr:hypothetical protein SAMN05444423_104437 [Nocardia asteroides]VEG34200.1 Uncharacterised protein [Nocardia asteroides]
MLEEAVERIVTVGHRQPIRACRGAWCEETGLDAVAATRTRAFELTETDRGNLLDPMAMPRYPQDLVAPGSSKARGSFPSPIRSQVAPLNLDGIGDTIPGPVDIGVLVTDARFHRHVGQPERRETIASPLLEASMLERLGDLATRRDSPCWSVLPVADEDVASTAAVVHLDRAPAQQTSQTFSSRPLGVGSLDPYVDQSAVLTTRGRHLSTEACQPTCSCHPLRTPSGAPIRLSPKVTRRTDKLAENGR